MEEQKQENSTVSEQNSAKREVSNTIPESQPVKKSRTLLFGVIAVILIGVGVGAGYYLSNYSKNPRQDKAQTQKSTPSPSIEKTQMKKYQSQDNTILMSYPADWTAKETNTSGNPSVTEFSGPEGDITIMWGGSGYGGGCDTQYHALITLANGQEDSCDTVTNNAENWMIQFNKSISGDVRATANAPYETNRTTVLNVLKTLQINDTSTDTASWKTYTDSKKRFSFKYPSDFTTENLSTSNGDGMTIVENNDVLVQIDTLDQCDENTQPQNTSKITIDNMTTTKNDYGKKICSTVNKNGKNYEFILDHTSGPLGKSDKPLTSEQKEIYNNILSTFKFTQ